MPLVMKKTYQISGNYTDNEKEMLVDMINAYRSRMADDMPEKNILNKKKTQYSDNQIIQFLRLSTNDLNGGTPRTNFTMFDLYSRGDDDLVVLGAIVFTLMSEGILQLRNQMDFSDSGLSISMFNKTGAYQGWASFLMQEYMLDKKEFKSSVIPSSGNSGFFGISSEFGYREF